MRRTPRWLALSLPVALLAVGSTATVRAGDGPPASAAAAWKPLLWVVEGKPTIYLFGTIPVPDKRLDEKPPALKAALAACDVFYAQLPQDTASQMKFGTETLLPAGKTFEQSVPKGLYDRTRALLQTKGYPIETFAQAKVWVVAVAIGMLDYLADLSRGATLEKRLYEEQVSARKEVGGIETVEEQLAMLDGLSSDWQAKFLAWSLTRMEASVKAGRSPAKDLVDAFLQGDETTIAAAANASFVDKDDKETPAVLKVVIDERNVRMVDRLLERAKAAPEKTYFLAVGSAHFPGPNGVLALLEKKGLKPRRLGPTDAIPVKAKEPAATK